MEEVDDTAEVLRDIYPSSIHAACGAYVRQPAVIANTSSVEMKNIGMKEIDETTIVPVDIYRSLLLAARDADVGQHQIVKGPKGVRKLKLTEQCQKDALVEKTAHERVNENRQLGQQPEIPKHNASRGHDTQISVIFSVPLARTFPAIVKTLVWHMCQVTHQMNHQAAI